MDYFTKTFQQRMASGKNTVWMGYTRSNKFVVQEVLPAPLCPVPPEPVAVPPIAVTPFPNPPPRKRDMDECCRASVQLLRRIHKHLGVSPAAGMEPIEQIAGVKTKGENYQGGKMNFPFEVPKLWLDVQAKKNEKITIQNLAELLLVMGAQSERLERVLGTKEFIKDSEGKLRQSEGNLCLGCLEKTQTLLTPIQMTFGSIPMMELLKKND
jgi:hypothetical protein